MTLESDGESINETLQDHETNLPNALRTTSGRLTQLSRLRLLEKYSVNFALAVFTLACAYIICKRLRLIQAAVALLRTVVWAMVNFSANETVVNEGDAVDGLSKITQVEL